VPYLVNAPREYHSTFFNQTDTERVSYEPPLGEGQDPVRVGFFGGSAMAGIGQRDEHTIPSEFARLAEDAGVPVEVHNFGVAGWVSWQELLYLERLLAQGEQLDLLVFYDGFNDVTVQQSEYSIHPVHNGVPQFQEIAGEYHEEHYAAPTLLDGFHEVADAYTANSAIARLVDRIRGDVPDPVPGTQPQTEAGPEQQLEAALGIYGRTQDLVRDLADDHGLPVRFYWQPQAAGWPPEAIAGLPPGTTDLSHVFDDVEEPLYIDTVHTNEEGARLVAVALWDDLGDEVEDLAAAG
jgi:lysophospholipase L1-like esterase